MEEHLANLKRITTIRTTGDTEYQFVFNNSLNALVELSYKNKILLGEEAFKYFYSHYLDRYLKYVIENPDKFVEKLILDSYTSCTDYGYNRLKYRIDFNMIDEVVYITMLDPNLVKGIVMWYSDDNELKKYLLLVKHIINVEELIDHMIENRNEYGKKILTVCSMFKVDSAFW